MDTKQLYEQAEAKVMVDSNKLAPHTDFILAGWHESDEYEADEDEWVEARRQ